VGKAMMVARAVCFGFYLFVCLFVWLGLFFVVVMPPGLDVCLFVYLFVVIPENPYFTSRPGLKVKTLGVYPLGPRSSSCGPAKGTPLLRTILRTT